MSRLLADIKVTRIGAKLKRLRKHHALTLKQVAETLGMTSHTYLSEVENSRKPPSIELVLALALLYGATTDELLFDEKELKQSLPEK